MRVLFFALAFLAIGAAPASAWGGVGHRLIMELAYARLTPAARSTFDRLLAAGPARPLDACPLVTREEVATWADCARSQEAFKATYDEHFDDIPLFARASRRDYCRAGDCATQAIARNRRLLGDTRLSDGARLEALAFLVHYVGDIHQPLHAADNADRGGNDVKVIYLGAATYPGRDGAPVRFNLHGVWDTPLVGAALADGGRAAIADAVDAALRTRASADPRRWARESHEIAVAFAYGGLPVAMAPGAPPPEPVAIDQAYVDRATPIVRKQIARATARLVVTLNVALERWRAP